MSENIICPCCGKEHLTEVVVYGDGVEICNECFETVLRVTEFGNLKNATPEELTIFHNWAKAVKNYNFPKEVDVKKLKNNG